MPSVVNSNGVTVTSGRLVAWFSHHQLEMAPPNPDSQGGVILRDEKGREWVMDALWMSDYRRAYQALQEAISLRSTV